MSNANLLNKEKQIRQAVLVCDDFDKHFQPLTDQRPLALFPLVNVSLIEHSLHLLRAGGIQHVLAFSSHAQRLREHLQQRDWIKPVGETGDQPFVQVIASDTLSSLGDVMREVFNNQLIKSDFVLLEGSVVGLLPLDQYLKKHVIRRLETDRGSVMTLICRQMDLGHRSRLHEPQTLLLTERRNGKLLHYEPSAGYKSRTELSLATLKHGGQVQIRFDLKDTGVMLCSAAVPQLFTDNFDYSTKEDFIRGLLVEEDILGNSIYVQTTDRNYAARVHDPRSYDFISRDMLQRWSYPSVPDAQSDLVYHRNNVYKSPSVDLQFDAQLASNVVLGKNTVIGSGVYISNSIIGDNCLIGDYARIENSYLWNEIKVGNRSQLDRCLIASNVEIKSNCKVNSGCLIGERVIIGPTVELPQCTILVWSADKDKLVDKSLIGKEGRGFVYMKEESDYKNLDEESCPRLLTWGLEDEQANNYNILNWNSGAESNDESDDGEFSDNDSNKDENNDAICAQEENHVDDEVESFYNEVIDSLQRGFEERINCNNLILEINGSKHAYNIPIRELVMLVVKSVLELPLILAAKDKPMNENLYLTRFTAILDHFTPLLCNYVKSNESQKDCLLTMEHFAISNPLVFTPTTFSKTLKFLYDQDILEEEIILAWHKQPKPLPSLFVANNGKLIESQQALRNKSPVVAYVNWLMTAEVESSEEEEED